MKITKLRIGNIGFRPITAKDDENCNRADYLGKFICYQENPYYGHENDFVQCELDPDYYYNPDGNTHGKIHKSCFSDPEDCYVLAWLLNIREPDIKSVGDRPWTLNDEDEKDLKQVITMVYERIYKSED